MFNSSPLVYCNCVSVPVLHCSGVYSPWNCPVPTPAPGFGVISLDGMATHSALPTEQDENISEPSVSRRLKFGIENILYGTSSQQDHHEVRNQFPCNQDLSFITHQPFSQPMCTSARPWCRPVFTQLQRRGLERRFQATKYVTKRERLEIGAILGLSETQVKVWFQNRRTKWRHEAARKEEKQKEQTLKQTKSINQQQRLKCQNDKKEGSDEVCSLTSSESAVDDLL